MSMSEACICVNLCIGCLSMMLAEGRELRIPCSQSACVRQMNTDSRFGILTYDGDSKGKSKPPNTIAGVSAHKSSPELLLLQKVEEETAATDLPH